MEEPGIYSLTLPACLPRTLQIGIDGFTYVAVHSFCSVSSLPASVLGGYLRFLGYICRCIEPEESFSSGVQPPKGMQCRT
jgi:hypothetical protein